MSVIDILFRVDAVCKKYDKYDIDKQREHNAYGDDAFARVYAVVDSTIQQALTVCSFFFPTFLIMQSFNLFT
jgi:SYP7 family syntaxin